MPLEQTLWLSFILCKNFLLLEGYKLDNGHLNF